MTTLNLYDRPAQGTQSRMNLVGLFDNWRRTKRAIGGHHLGRFSIKSLGMPQLTDFYNTWLGYKITEETLGITSYEGIIWQLDLIKNGVNYRRTLNPKYWNNRVKVLYTDSAGDRQVAAWSENTDSSSIYGEMEMILTLGQSNGAGATALRDRALVESAWPKSRTVGSIDAGDPSPLASGDGLYVTTAGFSTTLNWQFRESNSSDTASALITTLVGETEFVSAGRIETNALATAVDGEPVSQRIGDMIGGVLAQGDASGNIWKGGVYADQKFVYEQAPTTIDYTLINGALYDKANNKVNPALQNPGFYVRDISAPAGYQPPGTSNIWDDPQVSYCDEIEFIWPDILRLKFPGENLLVEIISEQVKRGRYPFNLLNPPKYGSDPFSTYGHRSG